MRAIAALLTIMAVLAGCSGPQETHFTVPDDAKSHQDAYAGNGFELRVRVTDHNGTPLAGAAVVWFTGGDGVVAFSGAGSVGPGGPRGEGDLTISFAQSGADMLAGARTGADGAATADLEPGRAVHVAVGDAAGFTTEVRFNVAVGSGGDKGTISVVLYPERLSIDQLVTMGNHIGVAGHLGQPAMESWPLPLAADGTLDSELRSRLHTIDLAATWENAVGEGADLYVGLGTDAATPRWVGDDKQQFVADGSHTETLYVDDAGQARDDLAARGLHVFLLTDWISGGMNGVAVQVTGEAVLKGSNVIID